MRVPLGIIGGNTYGRNSKISLAETGNMYVTDGALVSYPGYKKIATYSGLQARGIYVNKKSDIFLMVIDNIVYKVNDVFSASVIGRITTETGPVFIAANDVGQFCISDGKEIYIYDGINEVRPVSTPPNAPFLPGYMDYQDGYFISCDKLSNKWVISHLDDGDNWAEIDSGTGLTYSARYGMKVDTMVAVVSYRRQIFVIGQEGAEIWRDVGNTLFPYQRDNSISIDHGCVNPETIAEGFGYIVWLSQNEYSNPTIVVSDGGSPVPLLNDGIDVLLQSLVKPEDSAGFLFEDGDHIFYQLTFYSDNVSLIYDFTQKSFYTVTDENYSHHIARRLINFNYKFYFISTPIAGATDVGLYEMSSRYTTYDNADIPRYRITPPIRREDGNRFIINSCGISIQQGTSKYPKRVGLAMTKNGGISFGAPVFREFNAFGYGANRMVYRKLGSANDVSFRFTFWSGNGASETPVDNGDLHKDFCVVNGYMELN